MEHLGTKLLETNRLILRRFTLEDAAAVYKNWASDEEVTKFLMWKAHHDIAVTEAVVKNWWHMGITSEALQCVLDYLFDEVGFYRIESRHDPRNPNSGGVMKKCGMKEI